MKTSYIDFGGDFPPEPKVKVMIPIYEPLETVKCKKCGKIMAEPKELIRIKKG